MTKPELKIYIGTQVRKHREARGIGQQALADFLGMVRASVVNIEQGRQSLSAPLLFQVCCALDCMPNDFFPEVTPAKVIEIEEVVTRTKKLRSLK